MKQRKRAWVYLWTGAGWGKTTSSIGVAIRAIGQGKNAVIIQFMKGRKDIIGEYRIRKRLSPDYEIYQFGRPGWVDLANPGKIDRKLAEKGFEFAKKRVQERPPFLLVLDEINLACNIGLLKTEDVLKFLDKVPAKTTVYLTGRFAPKKLIERADYVTEIRPIKHPKAPRSLKGIDY